jgi:hypothetical protein
MFGHPNDLKSKSLNYKVVDLVEYYNFDIKFVFIGHHMRKLRKFPYTISLSIQKTDSDDPMSLSVLSINVGFS